MLRGDARRRALRARADISIFDDARPSTMSDAFIFIKIAGSSAFEALNQMIQRPTTKTPYALTTDEPPDGARHAYA